MVYARLPCCLVAQTQHPGSVTALFPEPIFEVSLLRSQVSKSATVSDSGRSCPVILQYSEVDMNYTVCKT